MPIYWRPSPWKHKIITFLIGKESVARREIQRSLNAVNSPYEEARIDRAILDLLASKDVVKLSKGYYRLNRNPAFD